MPGPRSATLVVTLISGLLGRNGNGLVLRRIEVGVVDEFHEHIAGAIEIGDDRRNLGANANFHGTTRQGDL